MYRIGIDLGGTNIVAAVVSDTYEMCGTAKCKTARPRPAEAIVDDMARMAKEAVAAAGVSWDEIECVGVGSPGTCNADTGTVEISNNLGFHHVPVCAMLTERLFGKPVYLENDANAAAIGEYLAGAAKGAHSCVCITLGTGVGGGIIVDGKVLSGCNFAAAEVGHSVIVYDGVPCSCGRKGCFESYASATALIRQTKEAMEKHPDSVMWQLAGDIDSVSGRTAFDAMRAGDTVGTQVVEQYINYLACGLTNMVNIFQPEILCIGGGICNEGDTLVKPLEAYIARERYSQNSEVQTRLCVATLGNDAGVIGAAFLDRVK